MSNHNKKVSPMYSWPVIIIATIIFWPVAIYLVYKRIKTDKRAGFKTAEKIVRYLSYFCFFMCIAGLIVLFTEGFTGQDFGMLAFFLVAGAVLFIFSKKLVANAEKYKKYISIIINGNEVRLDNIAEIISLPISIVRKDLNEMIKNGYFEDAYINDSTDEIILKQQSDDDTEYATEQIQPRIVTCNCCGAKKKVTTRVAECEYCGSPL